MRSPFNEKAIYHWKKIDYLYGADISSLSTIIIQMDEMIRQIPTTMMEDENGNETVSFDNGAELQQWVMTNLEIVIAKAIINFDYYLQEQDAKISEAKLMKDEDKVH